MVNANRAERSNDEDSRDGAHDPERAKRLEELRRLIRQDRYDFENKLTIALGRLLGDLERPERPSP